MTAIIRTLTLLAATAALLGLSQCATDTSDPTTSTREGALTGGCKTICPKCKPGAICPMIACYLDCNGKKQTCVQTAMCIQGYAWSPAKCACVPATGGSKCQSDADCYLAADYCTGCNCSALQITQSVPACSGPGVRCFADPCLTHSTTCDVNSGKCLLQ